MTNQYQDASRHYTYSTCDDDTLLCIYIVLLWKPMSVWSLATSMKWFARYNTYTASLYRFFVTVSLVCAAPELNCCRIYTTAWMHFSLYFVVSVVIEENAVLYRTFSWVVKTQQCSRLAHVMINRSG